MKKRILTVSVLMLLLIFTACAIGCSEEYTPQPYSPTYISPNIIDTSVEYADIYGHIGFLTPNDFEHEYYTQARQMSLYSQTISVIWFSILI